MKNNNDITAKYYDIISRFTKHGDITLQEVNLIRSFIDKDSIVLEIGSGTGRHAVQLAEHVDKLVCIDSSEAMQEEASTKLQNLNITNVELLNVDFLQYENTKFESQFNFIYLMWNTYNEIVLNEADCARFFQQCKKYLVPGGKILINIDDSKNVDPSCFNFNYEMTIENEIVGYSWKTEEYDESTNTSVCREVIKIDDVSFETLIKQRYWNPEQIMQLASQYGFVFIKNEKIQGNDELYMIFRS